MQITPEQKSYMLSLIEVWYPNWQGIDDPRYQKDESSYKRRAVAQASRILAKEIMTQQMEQGAFDQLTKQVRELGISSELLRVQPPNSDFEVFNARTFSAEAFCRALFDLLHGPGPTPERLTRWVEWTKTQGVAANWPFPTIYLGLLYPADEFMVKPRRVSRVLKMLNTGVRRPPEPTAESYTAIREMARAVTDAFAPEGAVDMIDAHSIIWTAGYVEGQLARAKREKVKTAEATPNRADDEEEQVDEVDEVAPAVESLDGPFSPRTFSLLAGIRDNPTMQFYNAHKEEFHSEVEAPFQRVVRTVAERLDPRVKQLMETEKGIFSRFRKNDFGLGGAWPHYWSAFYPRGSKRKDDAQLSVFLNANALEYGFFIGEYGSSQRSRFVRNLQRLGQMIAPLMESRSPAATVTFGGARHTPPGNGASAGQTTWADFVADPDKYNCDVGRHFSPEQLLATDEETLVEAICAAHQQLYPLVLLALLDDPMPAIKEFVGAEDDEDDKPYDRSAFLAATSLTNDEADELLSLLEERKQLLLYGPPGTGKTWVARELGKLLTGLSNPPRERMEIVQFHPAYGYEDFIEGIRPRSLPSSGGGHVVDYPVQPGVFQRFCQQARTSSGKCVFIIDEVNRGNIARIFGELLYLLEYRDATVALPYSGQTFFIPKNVYIIGTMNTADRSIALVDFALRRRFHFYRFAADPELLRRWLEANPNEELPYLHALYVALTESAIDDEHLRIGPSHFMRRGLTEAGLRRVWQRSVEPYLAEYYFDDPGRAARWRWGGEQVTAIRRRHSAGEG